jgi:aldose 1-epimerase
VSTDHLVFEAGGNRLTVSPGEGGRITSLVVDGQELIVTEGYGSIRWGCYPMVPFAGRIGAGRFDFAGREVRLPLNLPPHAIHGTVFERAWTVVAPDTLSIDLGPDWPFAGRVHQRFTLRAGGLGVELALEADEPMPGSIGWHPWFRRTLSGTPDQPRSPSAPVRLRFDAEHMYVKGADGLPTGELTEPGPHPWDDSFTGVRSAPRLTWPGAMALEIRSSCDHWVVYDEPVDAICVEPQTSPPDFPRIAPVTVSPGQPLRATMDWHWWPDGSAAGGGTDLAVDGDVQPSRGREGERDG